jgi:hypothetical protein
MSRFLTITSWEFTKAILHERVVGSRRLTVTRIRGKRITLGSSFNRKAGVSPDLAASIVALVDPDEDKKPGSMSTGRRVPRCSARRVFDNGSKWCRQSATKGGAASALQQHLTIREFVHAEQHPCLLWSALRRLKNGGANTRRIMPSSRLPLTTLPDDQAADGLDNLRLPIPFCGDGALDGIQKKCK